MGWDSNPRDALHACRFSRPRHGDVKTAKFIVGIPPKSRFSGAFRPTSTQRTRRNRRTGQRFRRAQKPAQRAHRRRLSRAVRPGAAIRAVVDGGQSDPGEVPRRGRDLQGDGAQGRKAGSHFLLAGPHSGVRADGPKDDGFASIPTSGTYMLAVDGNHSERD